MTRFVFLDRDGTLVRDTGYVHCIEEYELLPGVPDALRRLVAAGFALAIVTNQSGIARGLYDEAAYRKFEAHLEADLARHGVPITGSFFCPHAPDAGCACRKPAPGLLFAARDALGAELGASYVIGNERRDAEAGLAAGCRAALVVGPAPSEPLPPGSVRVPSIAAAADWILAQAR